MRLNLHPAHLAAGILALSLHAACGGCCADLTDAEIFGQAAAVVDAEVLHLECRETAGGSLETVATMRLVESFKGRPGPTFELAYPGGRLGPRAVWDSRTLALKVGKRYFLHLAGTPARGWTSALPVTESADPQSARANARRQHLRGAARGPRPHVPADLPPAPDLQREDPGPLGSGLPGSKVTATGWIESGLGFPGRFVSCDQAEPIPYTVDLDPAKLPSGMTRDQALAAVAEAFTAWSGASSLKFRFNGLATFGMAAHFVTTEDRSLRLQLHDSFNAITSTTTLGIGGGSVTFTPGSEGKSGATVAGQGFDERTYGYVILNHRSSVVNNPAIWKEVLTHELGHAIGIAHSSENLNETDPILADATMYYRVNNDGRGASLTAYDADRADFGHPLDNTPPFGIERLLQIVTTHPAYGSKPTGYGIDRVHLERGDLQTPAGLSMEIVTPRPGFDTTTVPGTAIYTAAAYSSDVRLSDSAIAAGSGYDTLSYRWFDGTHYSPIIKVRLIGFWQDTKPADGLPDSWMQANFGTITPGNVGSPSHPESDPDGDGLVNRVELYLQTDPNNPTSGPARLMIGSLPDRRLDWSAVRFAPYVVESSPDLATWTTRRCASDYAGTGVLSSHLPEDAAVSRMFYRLKMEP